MPTVYLADLFQALPPVDAYVLSNTCCLLLLSHAAEPSLPERKSALVLVDRLRSDALLLGEFPGASELVLWSSRAGGGGPDLQVLVTSPGGHLWELQPQGTVRPKYDAFGEEGPTKYGFLNCCTSHAGFVYVGGMCNQLYRTPNGLSLFERADAPLLDREMADADSAIYGLADLGGKFLLGVGGGGMVFWMDAGRPRFLDSGTNGMINAVSAVDSEMFVACGAGGLVLRGSIRGWCRPEESGFPGVYFSDVRTQGRRHLWIGGQRLHVSEVGDGWSEVARVLDAPVVCRFARGGTSTWVVGSTCLGWTEDGDHWTWLPTKSIPVATTQP